MHGPSYALPANYAENTFNSWKQTSQTTAAEETQVVYPTRFSVYLGLERCLLQVKRYMGG